MNYNTIDTLQISSFKNKELSGTTAREDSFEEAASQISSVRHLHILSKNLYFSCCLNGSSFLSLHTMWPAGQPPNNRGHNGSRVHLQTSKSHDDRSQRSCFIIQLYQIPLPISVGEFTALETVILLLMTKIWKTWDWNMWSKLREKECYRNCFVNPNCVITSWLGHLSSEQEIRDNGNFLLLKWRCQAVLCVLCKQS